MNCNQNYLLFLISADGIFTDVIIEGKRTKIRKQRLCWLAQKDHVKISSDVSRRYIPDQLPILKEITTDSSQIMWKSDTIARGEIIIVKNNEQLFLGTILNFHKHEEKTKKGRTFLKDFVSLKLNSNVSCLLDPIKIVQHDMSLKDISETHRYSNQKHYICHISSYQVDLKTNLVKQMLNTFIDKPSTSVMRKKLEKSDNPA